MKITITNDTIAEVKAIPRTAISVSVDTTGMTLREQADMFMTLASTLEEQADREERAEVLRQVVVESDPSLATETRLPLELPEVIELHDGKGARRGVARLIHECKVSLPEVEEEEEEYDPTEEWEIDYPDEAEDTHTDDDEVEFKRGGQWVHGIVAGVSRSPECWQIEDDYGRIWEVHEKGIRKVDVEEPW